MGVVKVVKPAGDWVIHCDIVTTESGQQIPMFWRDMTFHSFFERLAWETGGQ